MEIKVKNLVKHFGDTRAVDDISFSFSTGQIVGFVGPNGAGKTTTIRIMASLEDATSGDILFDDVSILQDPEKVRHYVGYMPDSLPTHRDMIVHDYLDFFARAYGIRTPKRQQVIHQIEEFTNLLGIRDKSLYALSKGMKQRVSLARALLHDPKVLILDEPAAGLDPRARVELRELLMALSEQGKAVLLSSHILTELAEVCTNVVIIEQGKLLKSSDMGDLAKVKSEFTVLTIRALGSTEELCKELLQLPHIRTARVVGEYVDVDLDGQDEQCHEVLCMLLERNHKIVEFHQKKAKLEDVFMNITEGQVQ